MSPCYELLIDEPNNGYVAYAALEHIEEGLDISYIFWSYVGGARYIYHIVNKPWSEVMKHISILCGAKDQGTAITVLIVTGYVAHFEQ